MYMHNSTGKVKRSVYNESSVPERLRDNRSCQEASVWSLVKNSNTITNESVARFIDSIWSFCKYKRDNCF